ncbi:MAG TPA: MarR family transcriptional regulator [Rubrobacter sp.]|nr:MarR family transcriptional regulator [Rubrobacter sp.]
MDKIFSVILTIEGLPGKEWVGMDGMREKRLEEVAGEVNPIYASVGSAFKRLLFAFESEVGMSPPRYFLLHMVANEGNISQGQVGHLSGVDPSRVTQVAKSLERDGLIQRHRDPKDNRVVRMRLTPQGRRIFEGAYAKREVLRARIRRALSQEEEDELRRLLDKVAEALED